MPSGLHSTSSTGIGANSTSAASLEKGCADSPWKERVQSTCWAPSSRMRGSSARPVVRSVMEDWASIEAAVLRVVVGVGEDGADDGVEATVEVDAAVDGSGRAAGLVMGLRT